MDGGKKHSAHRAGIGLRCATPHGGVAIGK